MFFTFDQNNVRGTFIRNDKITDNVIIEADTATQANSIAESIGCDFDDYCECCGNRWYYQIDEIDGNNTSTVYSSSLGLTESYWTVDGEVYARVYYLNGSVIEYSDKTINGDSSNWI